MRLASALLLAFTAAMILVHLTSTRLLRRAWAGEAPVWLSVLNIFRFEGIYYLALMAYVAWQSGRFLLIRCWLWPLCMWRPGRWQSGGGNGWRAQAGEWGGRAFWPACRSLTSRKR